MNKGQQIGNPIILYNFYLPWLKFYTNKHTTNIKENIFYLYFTNQNQDPALN